MRQQPSISPNKPSFSPGVSPAAAGLFVQHLSELPEDLREQVRGFICPASCAVGQAQREGRATGGERMNARPAALGRPERSGWASLGRQRTRGRMSGTRHIQLGSAAKDVHCGDISHRAKAKGMVCGGLYPSFKVERRAFYLFEGTLGAGAQPLQRRRRGETVWILDGAFDSHHLCTNAQHGFPLYKHCLALFFSTRTHTMRFLLQANSEPNQPLTPFHFWKV